jgi:hypothetical protein
MKIQVHLKKELTPHSWENDFMYVADMKPFLKFKFPSKQHIIETVSKKRGLPADYIIKNFSKNIDELYNKKLNEYIVRKIVDDTKFSICEFVQHKSLTINYSRLAFNEKELKFYSTLNYSDSVKNSMYQDAKWVFNYKNGISIPDKCPFTFGDKEKIDFLENIMSEMGEIEIEVNEPTDI